MVNSIDLNGELDFEVEQWDNAYYGLKIKLVDGAILSGGTFAEMGTPRLNPTFARDLKRTKLLGKCASGSDVVIALKLMIPGPEYWWAPFSDALTALEEIESVNAIKSLELFVAYFDDDFYGGGEEEWAGYHSWGEIEGCFGDWIEDNGWELTWDFSSRSGRYSKRGDISYLFDLESSSIGGPRKWGVHRVSEGVYSVDLPIEAAGEPTGFSAEELASLKVCGLVLPCDYACSVSWITDISGKACDVIGIYLSEGDLYSQLADSEVAFGETFAVVSDWSNREEPILKVFSSSGDFICNLDGIDGAVCLDEYEHVSAVLSALLPYLEFKYDEDGIFISFTLESSDVPGVVKELFEKIDIFHLKEPHVSANVSIDSSIIG